MTLLLETSAKDVDIDPMDWPRCAICRMPVEEFIATDTGESFSFIAICHGQREVVDIPDELWDNTIGTYTGFGQAFKENHDGPAGETLD